MGQVSYLWLRNRDIVTLKRDVMLYPSLPPQRDRWHLTTRTYFVLLSQLVCLPVFRNPGVASQFWGLPSLISPRFPRFFDKCGLLLGGQMWHPGNCL